MINKIIEQVKDKIHLEHQFRPKSLCLKTQTWVGEKLVHTHSFDLTPIYEEFKKRLQEEE